MHEHSKGPFQRILLPVAIVAAGVVACFVSLAVAWVLLPLLVLLVPLVLVPFLWLAVLVRRTGREATLPDKKGSRRSRRVYAVGLSATIVVAVVVGWTVYQWRVLLPDVAELADMPSKNLYQEVASPGGTWKAANYIKEDWYGEVYSYVVLSPRDGSAEPHIVYYGVIADVSWQGDSAVVVRRHTGGRERLDAASGFYDIRFGDPPWDYLIVAVVVLVPTMVVVVLGVAITAVLASGPSRRRAR